MAAIDGMLAGLEKLAQLLNRLATGQEQLLQDVNEASRKVSVVGVESQRLSQRVAELTARVEALEARQRRGDDTAPEGVDPKPTRPE